MTYNYDLSCKSWINLVRFENGNRMSGKNPYMYLRLILQNFNAILGQIVGSNRSFQFVHTA